MSILIENRQTEKIDLRRIRSVLTKIMKQLKYEDRELSLVLVDDEGIREINKTYLARDYATNVIAFAMQEGEYGDINPQVLGDIMISVETARVDAERDGIDLADELDFLMIHGLLHLTGYNHENTTAAESARMKNKESEIFFFLKGYCLAD
jgi:probable rRNA maturation factor